MYNMYIYSFNTAQSVRFKRKRCKCSMSSGVFVRATRAIRSANQRARNQRKQIPSAPKLRPSNLELHLASHHRPYLQFLSPPLQGPYASFSVYTSEGSSNQATMLARSLLRAAPARATARQSLRQNSVRTTTPSRRCDSHWIVSAPAMALSYVSWVAGMFY